MYVTLSFVDYSVAMVTDVCRVVTIRRYVIATSVYTTARERERGDSLYPVQCMVYSVKRILRRTVYSVHDIMYYSTAYTVICNNTPRFNLHHPPPPSWNNSLESACIATTNLVQLSHFTFKS